MKKTLFVLLIVIGACKLQAQQLTFTSPDLLFKSPKTFPELKLNDTLLFKNCPGVTKPGQLLALNRPKQDKNEEIVYSTMPVIKSHSDDRMPVIKPGDSNMRYTMLVKRVKVINPLEKQSVLNP
ncbi:MAG: hypothetical protein JST19_22990 [Bacteroidetes bacterium]|nr:hypothetical protein [Bacteroidota bacterium]